MSTIPHPPRDSQSSSIKPGTRKRLVAYLTLLQRMTLHISMALFLESLSLKNGFAACKLQNHKPYGRLIAGFSIKCIICKFSRRDLVCKTEAVFRACDGKCWTPFVRTCQ